MSRGQTATSAFMEMLNAEPAPMAAFAASSLPIFVTVERADGIRTEIVVQKPFARIGRDRRAEVAITDSRLLPCHAYLHATREGIYCAALATDVFSGWVTPQTPLEVAGIRLRVALPGRASSQASPADLQARQSCGPGGPRLRVFRDKKDDGGFTDFSLERRLTLVGRQSPATWRIKHPTLSRLHCAFVWEGGELWLVDLFSSNGTRVAGARFDAGLLKIGQEFTLGTVRCLYLGESAGVTAPAIVRPSEAQTDPASEDEPLHGSRANISEARSPETASPITHQSMGRPPALIETKMASVAETGVLNTPPSLSPAVLAGSPQPAEMPGDAMPLAQQASDRLASLEQRLASMEEELRAERDRFAARLSETSDRTKTSLLQFSERLEEFTRSAESPGSIANELSGRLDEIARKQAALEHLATEWDELRKAAQERVESDRQWRADCERQQEALSLHAAQPIGQLAERIGRIEQAFERQTSAETEAALAAESASAIARELSGRLDEITRKQATLEELASELAEQRTSAQERIESDRQWRADCEGRLEALSRRASEPGGQLAERIGRIEQLVERQTSAETEAALAAESASSAAHELSGRLDEIARKQAAFDELASELTEHRNSARERAASDKQWRADYEGRLGTLSNESSGHVQRFADRLGQIQQMIERQTATAAERATMAENAVSMLREHSEQIAERVGQIEQLVERRLSVETERAVAAEAASSMTSSIRDDFSAELARISGEAALAAETLQQCFAAVKDLEAGQQEIEREQNRALLALTDTQRILAAVRQELATRREIVVESAPRAEDTTPDAGEAASTPSSGDADAAASGGWLEDDELTQRLLDFRAKRQQTLRRGRLMWALVAVGVTLTLLTATAAVLWWQ